MSVQAFARQRGITPQRLYWWRKRLTVATGATSTMISLVPAEVIVNRTETSGRVVVRLPSAVEIDLDNVSPGWVAALIRELVRPA
jgi:hypothetical protein